MRHTGKPSLTLRYLPIIRSNPTLVPKQELGNQPTPMLSPLGTESTVLPSAAFTNVDQLLKTALVKGGGSPEHSTQWDIAHPFENGARSDVIMSRMLRLSDGRCFMTRWFRGCKLFLEASRRSFHKIVPGIAMSWPHVLLLLALFGGAADVTAFRLVAHSAHAEEEVNDAASPTPPDAMRPSNVKPLPDYEALIDLLANRTNRAPVIVKVKPLVIIPVFLDQFEPVEQGRVRDVARALARHPGNDLWPRLNAHLRDQRYALTYDSHYAANLKKRESETYNGPHGINRHRSCANMTVGDICRNLASQMIDAPCSKHLPRRKSWKERLDLGLPLFPYPQQFKSRGSGQTERLSEVQAELCQFVLDHSSRVVGMTDEEREEFLKGVREELKRLQQTNVALMPQAFDFDPTEIDMRYINSFRDKYTELARKQLEEEEQKGKP